MDDQRSNPGKGREFFSLPQYSDQFWGLSRVLSNGYWGLSPRG